MEAIFAVTVFAIYAFTGPAVGVIILYVILARVLVSLD
jgi:hypothetical protein